MLFCGLIISFAFVCVVQTSPLPRVTYSSEAYINCNDINLVRRREDVAIPFSCIRGTGKPFVLTVEDEGLSTSFEPTSGQKVSLEGTGGEITLILDETMPRQVPSGSVVNIREYDVKGGCLDPARCGTENYQSTSPHTQYETVYIEPVAPKCPNGYTFVSEIGECLSVGVSSPSTSQREQYFIPNSENLRIRECKEGYYFDLNKGKCLRNNKFVSASNKHNKPFVIENDLRRCKGGYVFVSEIGLCLPIPYDVVSRPQNTEPATVSLKFSDTNCPKGSVYNPEVDLCLAVTQPITQQQEKPQTMSQVTHIEGPVVTIEKKKCKPGTLYNPEIDLCSPIDVQPPQGDDPAPLVSNKESTVKSKPSPDPFRPVLLPLTAESIGASKCKKNEVYVSEIDLCLEA